MKWLSFILLSLLVVQGCSSFKAERVSRDESDEKALSITDEWVLRDTEDVVKDLLEQITKHRGFRNYMSQLGRAPKLFVGEVQNRTSEAYFPIDDLNDEMLNEFSRSGDYVLVDAAARESLLKEITYQNDGMVNPQEAKTIGKQAGADLIIFGTIHMNPKSRSGKTIKEYTVNMRMTDIEKGVEVLRTRSKVNKYSKKSSFGW